MKREPIKRSLLLLVQWAGLSIVDGALIALSLGAPVPAALYAAVMWGILPAAGAWSAYWAARRGLSAYAAWIAPPVCQTAAHWALTGYPPSSAGMPLAAAAVSMVAAAAAEVMRERGKRRAK